MTSISGETLLEQLRWRYATKNFNPTRTIPAEDWRALEEALVLTPSSFGLQPWKFFVITNSQIKAQLVPLSWGQKQVLEGSHVVVFARRSDLTAEDVERYLQRMVEVRGGTLEALAGFRKMLLASLVPPANGLNIAHWAALQCYIALGNFMTSAALLGIDTCPMEGIDPAKYDELLGLRAQGYHTVVVCVAGYRKEDDKYARLPKVRFATEEVIQRLE